MNTTTIVTFIVYFLVIFLIGFIAGKRKKETADDYFLSGRRLPWYAIGLSMIASNVSTEHFIGVVGAAYLYGYSPANWDFSSIIPLSIFVFFFLPFYFRSKLYTIPQFLEKRYNHHTRSIFALLTILHSVIVILAGALYAGGLIFQDLFSPEGVAATKAGMISSSLIWGIVIIAVTTGAYCIYGGLDSVVWTDVFQVIILIIAGLMVTFIALNRAGGWDQVVAINAAANEARLHLIKPMNDPLAPWTGVATIWLTLGIWFNCANQFYIQQSFGARSEWDARMGIVLTGFLKALMPLIFVVPGVIAFALYGPGLQQDKVFMHMLQDLLSPGFQAIVLTGLAAAIMSTISSILNSSSTIFTIDIYQRHINPAADQRGLVKVGRITVAVVLLVAMVCAPFILLFGKGLFVYIQDMASFFAPPISVIFLSAILWKQAMAKAANWTLVLGILFGIMLRLSGTYMSGEVAEFLNPFLNRALLNWIFSFVLMVVVSLSSYRSLPAEVEQDIIWKSSYARLPPEERKRYGGFRNFYIWWILVVLLRVVIYFFWA